MIRSIISILLIFTLTAPFTLKLGLIVHYELNVQNITKTFCVNKDKPKMHCNGKCHLAKQLKKISQDDTQKNPNKPANTNQLPHLELLFCKWENNLNPNFSIFKCKQICAIYYSSSLNKGYSTPLFSPPQFLL